MHLAVSLQIFNKDSHVVLIQGVWQKDVRIGSTLELTHSSRMMHLQLEIEHLHTYKQNWNSKSEAFSMDEQ